MEEEEAKHNTKKLKRKGEDEEGEKEKRKIKLPQSLDTTVGKHWTGGYPQSLSAGSLGSYFNQGSFCVFHKNKLFFVFRNDFHRNEATYSLGLVLKKYHCQHSVTMLHSKH